MTNVMHKKTVRYLTNLIIFMIGLLNVACSTVYQQQQGVAAKNIAVLQHPDPERSLFIIEKVDNKWRGPGLIERYELLPGEHVITCAFQKPGNPDKRIHVNFKAEAGKKYRAEIRIAGNDWAVVVLEDATRKIISTMEPQIKS